MERRRTFRETGGTCRYFGPQGRRPGNAGRSRSELALARSQGQALTSEEIAEQVHLSRITIRRYVNYMVETGELVSSIDYQTGGRPSIRYRYTGSFGAAGKGST